MGKKKGRKVKSKFKTFILVIVLLFVFIFVYLMLGAYVFKTKISTIVVHGNSYISDSTVVKAAGLENYPNFYLTSSNEVEKTLLKNEFIKSVEVKKNLFFEFHIYIKENKPLFIREDINKVVFNDGTSIDYVGGDLILPSLVNYVPDTKYDTLIKKMDYIDYEIIKKISDIKYEPNKYDEDRFLLYMNDSNRVYINLPKFKSLNKYDEMVTKFEGKTGVLYLDSGNYFQIDKKK